RLENYQITLLKTSGDEISINFDVRSIKDDNGKLQYFEGIVAKSESYESKYNELLEEIDELKKKAKTSNVDNDKKNEELRVELEALREKEKTSSSQVNKANYTKNVKSQYLANMTHEIKTPINSIVGFLTLIEQKLFDNEEELQDFAHNARTSADSLLEIINNILDISRLESDKMELDEEEFDLRKEVEKAKTISLPAGGKENLIVKTNISDKISSTVVGDSLRYRQVLVNILTNSVKYTESGSIEISVEVEKERELSYLIKTTVKDTGIGIPKDKLSLLFKPYTQVKTKKWNKQDGSGLGLMICKELIRLMDGEIIIKSKEGSGTIVEFTTSMKLPKALERFDARKDEIKKKLPIVENETLTTINEPEDKKNEEPIQHEDNSKLIAEEVVNSSDFNEEIHSDTKRILLVEDNPISQKVELKLLKESGYSVEAVSNGFDAIEAVKTNSFHLVLMDVEMAEMDGLESTRRIRALEAPTGKIPIIAVTAHSSMKDREKCLASGMDDYIAKPININFMKMTIGHWLLKEIEI
ncbi:MAG: response regulator, partial [Melioribacteraceae bacterium]|nr:response regulator [Melioribacteraceae bacterium]